MAPKTTSSKCETENDVGEISPTYKSIRGQELIVELNRYESIKNILEEKYEVKISEDLNINSSDPKKCMNMPSFESETTSFMDSSVGNKIRSRLSFTPPERENTHALAITLAPFESRAEKDNAKDKLTSESDKEPQMVNCSSIHPVCGTEQTIINADSSPECNKHIRITNFVCNDCKCQRESVNDLSCSKAKSNKESAGYLVLSEIDNEKKLIANGKPKELGHKVIFLKNPIPGDSKNQQDSGNDPAPTDGESRKMSSVSLGHGKYARDNKIARNVREKYQKETSTCKSELKFGRTNSTTSYTSNEENFQVPRDSLAEKIVRQAEFYFSDFNILKNNFLLKHIRRNKEGFLSLKLVSSFRKIKALTKDWRVVAYSLEGSKLLELNAEKSKVRRIVKIPKLRDTSYGKTVVVFNLPFKAAIDEDIKDLFSKFGAVVSAKIVTTKSPSYNIYHKRCQYFHQDIATNEFGVVEFEKYEDALAAVKDVESHLPKENEMKVVPLMPPKFRSDARGISTTSFANSRRDQRRFKPRSEMQKGRHMDEADMRPPPIADKYYRGNYRPRYGWKPQSYVDVRGKFPSERVVGKVDEIDKNHQVRRQPMAGNTMNVNHLHHHHRGEGHGPGRFYSGSRFHKTRTDIY